MATVRPACARRLAADGARMLAVALVEEGAELRRAGIDLPVLLLGPLLPEQIPHAVHDGLIPAVHDDPSLDALEALGHQRGERLTAHVKVDTGMGRIGFRPEQWEQTVARLANSSAVKVGGVFTNFAVADRPHDPMTARQLELLLEFISRLRGAGVDPGLVHASNSAATLAFPEGWQHAVRPGLALYGYSPAATVPDPGLEPVLAFETTVVQVKEVPAGTVVSYGADWSASRPSRLATIPVGYHDGWLRSLSNQGRVLFDAGVGTVVGRITMDMTMVDVTDVPGVSVGSAATLLGERGERRQSAVDLAEAMSTIPWEVLCGIGRRVPRVYLENHHAVGYHTFFRAGVGWDGPR